MSASKPAPSIVLDPVLAAFDNAPLDSEALTFEEAAALDAQIAAAEARMAQGERIARSGEEVVSDIAVRAQREG